MVQSLGINNPQVHLQYLTPCLLDTYCVFVACIGVIRALKQ